MRRFLTYLIAVPIAAVVVALSVVNRETVAVDLWPLPYEITMPLAGVMLISVGIGILIGGGAAWLTSLARRHEIKVRARAAEEALQREADALRMRLAQAEARAAQGPSEQTPSATRATLPPPPGSGS